MNFSSTVQSAPVVELLLARQRTRSQPGRRTDDRTVSLVIEGGTMRGVVSAGMVAALEQLGLRDSFDAVYGSSAGAISGAYFLAGQARYGTTIFYDNINNRKFVNTWRILHGRPVVSLEFLLDNVCVRQKPLMTERVLNSAIPLRVVAASLRKKKPIVLKDFSGPEELFHALRASSRIPFFAGPPVEFRGDRFLDASFYESIPFRVAIADGSTDLVILLTRPIGDLRSEPKWFDHWITAPYLKRFDPALPEHHLARAAEYRAEMEEINRYMRQPGPPRVHLVQVPAGTKKVRTLETSRAHLVEGAMEGFRAVYRTFGFSVPDLAEIITPVPDAASCS